MSLILALLTSAHAQDFGYVAIMQQAREALIAKDYKTAKTLLTAAEAAAPTSASPLGEADLANLWFYRGLVEWRSGDKDKAALDAWRKVLVVSPQFEPDAVLLPETDAQDVLYALRGEVRNYDQFATGLPDDSGDALIFIDGKRLSADDMLTGGRHLVQVRCPDGSFAGSWYDYGQAPADYLTICSGGTYSGKPVDPKVAKAAEKAKAEADKKAAAEKAAAEKAAAEKAAVEAKAAEKAKAEAEKKAAAEKAEAEKKAAANKAEAEKKAAAAAKTTPDKPVADKGEAEKKAAAEKAAAEAEKKAAAEKAAAEAEKKAAAEKAEADKKAATTKTATGPSEAEKKAAERAAAEKAAAEKATANVNGSGSTATLTPKKGGVDVPAVALMAVGGGLVAGGLVMNYTVVEPAYSAIQDGNANPGSLTRDAATAWEGRFDIGRYSTIGMVGGGAALLGVGVVLQVIDVPVAVLPNGIVVSGRW